MVVTNIETDELFLPTVAAAGSKLIVIDFYATWCGPCKMIAPAIHQFSVKYPDVAFFKVDVDKCKTVAQQCGISAMPTFQFFRNANKLDEVRGANPTAIEAKIVQYMNGGDAASSSSSSSSSSGATAVPEAPGYFDLNSSMILLKSVEILNCTTKNAQENLLVAGKSGIESDCDDQLIISIPFKSAVKIHSLKIKGPKDGRAPKNIKIFINKSSTISFEDAESLTPVQEITLTKEDVEQEKLIPLKFVKFQNVNNLVLFVANNQGNEETTAISSLTIIGTALNATDMTQLKKGEEDHNH